MNRVILMTGLILSIAVLVTGTFVPNVEAKGKPIKEDDSEPKFAINFSCTDRKGELNCKATSRDKIGAFNVINIRTFYFKNVLNGLKFILGDTSWLLIRSSETEPIIRFYAEGKSLEEAKMLVQSGIKLLGLKSDPFLLA